MSLGAIVDESGPRNAVVGIALGVDKEVVVGMALEADNKTIDLPPGTTEANDLVRCARVMLLCSVDNKICNRGDGCRNQRRSSRKRCFRCANSMIFFQKGRHLQS